MLANLRPIGGKLRKWERNSAICCTNATSPFTVASCIAAPIR